MQVPVTLALSDVAFEPEVANPGLLAIAIPIIAVALVALVIIRRRR